MIKGMNGGHKLSIRVLNFFVSTVESFLSCVLFLLVGFFFVVVVGGFFVCLFV